MQNDDKKPGLSWSTPAQSTAPKQQSSAPATPTTPVKSLPPASAASTNVSKYVGTLVGGIVIGILLAWGYSAVKSGSATSMMQNSNASTTTAANSASTMTMQAVATSTLDVPSPQSAGWSVKIANVTVIKPTWVVVYDNTGGKPGNTLGAQLFDQSGSGTVTLLRGTVAGQTYFVGMSVDNGEHKYAKATDVPILAVDGSVALATFTAQ